MFAVIDVETANQNSSGSICSIGIVLADETSGIQNTFYSLINPCCPFTPINVRIHHITPDLVADAPTFADLWPDIWALIQNVPIICYNASFDISAIKSALSDAELPLPDFRYACAMKLSKKLIKSGSYKLSAIAEHFGIEYDAHNALGDARATAQIMLELLKLAEADTLHDLMRACAMPFEYANQITMAAPARPADAASSAPLVYEPLKHGHSQAFSGKTVVFTGTLTCATRAAAQLTIEEMGGVCRTGVSKKTDIVIIGFYDVESLRPGATIGSKLQTALTLQAAGHPIKILDENDFMEILKEP